MENIDADGKAVAAESKGTRPKQRISFYEATEANEATEDAPFDTKMIATLSCKGLKPSENGAVEKINQDRGCICNPLGPPE